MNEAYLEEWVAGNLDITQLSIKKADARRWAQLKMADELAYYRLALYGFVLRRSRQYGANTYPEEEFLEFCAEFNLKLGWAMSGKVRTLQLPLFERTGAARLVALANGKRSEGRRYENN